jgi:hypothetical protein
MLGIINQIRIPGTVTVGGLSKLSLKLSSESQTLPVSTIAPDGIYRDAFHIPVHLAQRKKWLHANASRN